MVFAEILEVMFVSAKAFPLGMDTPVSIIRERGANKTKRNLCIKNIIRLLIT